MTIFYRLGTGLYINITNACPCACVFCIRNSTHTVGDAPSLWLDHEPTLAEITQAFDARRDLHEVTEVVFCGYGEPMMRPDIVLAVAEHIKSRGDYSIRLNTNGLVLLISPGFNMEGLEVLDCVSISLNAHSPEDYLAVARPQFGIDSFNALVSFAREAKKYTQVALTVMEDYKDIDACRQIANDLGVPLRVREYM